MQSVRGFVLAAVAATVVTGAVACGVPSQDPMPAPGGSVPQVPTPDKTRGDLSSLVISDHGMDGIHEYEADATVVNHSSKTSDYVIEFAVDDKSNTQVDSGSVFINNVTAGQTAKGSYPVVNLPDGASPSDYHLMVTSFQRSQAF